MAWEVWQRLGRSWVGEVGVCWEHETGRTACLLFGVYHVEGEDDSGDIKMTTNTASSSLNLNAYHTTVLTANIRSTW